jgi:hypothetical protein
MPRWRPKLSIEVILRWADLHRERTGRWPGAGSGPVLDAPGETWGGVNLALHRGHRGLPGGNSLALLLGRYGRGSCERRGRPPRGWTAEEDDLVRALPAQEAARRTGRCLRAVYDRRRELGVARRYQRRT